MVTLWSSNEAHWAAILYSGSAIRQISGRWLIRPGALAKGKSPWWSPPKQTGERRKGEMTTITKNTRPESISAKETRRPRHHACTASSYVISILFTHSWGLNVVLIRNSHASRVENGGVGGIGWNSGNSKMGQWRVGRQVNNTWVLVSTEVGWVSERKMKWLAVILLVLYLLYFGIATFEVIKSTLRIQYITRLYLREITLYCALFFFKHTLYKCLCLKLKLP